VVADLHQCVDVDEKPSGFSESDRLELEAIAQERKHRAWLWRLTKRILVTLMAVVMGLNVVWDAGVKLVKALSEHAK
jgi:hypothetical protein